MATTEPFTVDFSLYKRKTEKLLNKLDKDKPVFLDEQSGLLFRDVAKYTPPFANGQLPKANANTYGTNSDKKFGEFAVFIDIYRSMRPVGAAEKWKNPQIKEAVRQKDTQALKKIFANSNSVYKGWAVDHFDEKFHLQARNKYGRVRKKIRQLVVPKEEFVRYMRKVVSTVGQGKAYFAWAAMQMGRNDAPKWISRHFYKYRATVIPGENSRTAIGDHGAFVHTSRFLPRILEMRVTLAEKRLLFLTKNAIKTSGFKDKPA